MSDIVFDSLIELARRIRNKELSSTEVLDAHFDQVARYNSDLNAVVTLNEKEARELAIKADTELKQGNIWGPLHGVPITVKDSFETRGLLTTASFEPLAAYVPCEDATIVARLRQAGAIILGKTNMPELAMDIQSNGPIFGQACNPWNVDHSTGGSTGGGAAAVAAGLSPLELGSDLGGSVRLPAHYCGVYGYKPTENRISSSGHIPDIPPVEVRSLRHFACPGLLARSIEDIQLCLPLIEGPDGRDWEILPSPSRPVVERELRDYRFAWTDDMGGFPMDPQIREAVARAAESLADLGCQVERVSPPGFDFADALFTLGTAIGCELGSTMTADQRQMQREGFATPEDPGHFTDGIREGLSGDLQLYATALAKRDKYMGILDWFLSKRDAWLCPVSPMLAFPHHEHNEPFVIEGEKVNYTAASLNFTAIFNLTGNPAVSLPLSSSQEGLPIGLQVVGKRWHDDELLSLCALLAQEVAPFVRPPGYC